MEGAKTSAVPMTTRDTDRRCETTNSGIVSDPNIPYIQAIGCLLYLTNGTRPDITFAVNTLSRRQDNFTSNDWTQVKHIFRNLKGTAQLYLEFRGESDDLKCYPDASFDLNDPEGKSTSGYAIFMFNGLIVWRTKRQTHIALSSAEAEFVPMSLACPELANLKEMCNSRIMNLTSKVYVYKDNRSAIDLAKTEENHKLIKKNILRIHHVRTSTIN